jgi:mRNA interferase RelE/StbE
MLNLTYTRAAVKELRAMPAPDRERMRRRLNAYAADPDAPGHDVLPLAGEPGGFRLRSGDWRALFRMDGLEMTVYRIRHRREVYR